MPSKVKFLDKVVPLFLKKGYDEIKMDDIAEYLSISKKTIYKYFPTKEDLVISVNNHLITYFDKMITRYEEDSEHAIDLFYTIKRSVEKIASVGQQRNFFKQFLRVERRLRKKNSKFPRSAVYYIAERATKKAAEEGLLLDVYEQNVLNQIFANNYVSIKIHTIYDDAKELRRLEKKWFYMHLRGCLNEKGIKLLEEYVVRYPKLLHE